MPTDTFSDALRINHLIALARMGPTSGADSVSLFLYNAWLWLAESKSQNSNDAT